MDPFKEMIKVLRDGSKVLYVTGPASEDVRFRLTDVLSEALDTYDEYRRLAASEERIGG